MEELLGSRIINNKFEEILTEDVYKTKVIALLFTATWCSPCTIFEKELIDLYNEANIGDKLMEIIHISFDKGEDSFKKGIQNKPWLFIPFNDSKRKELTDKYQILSIPMFIVLKNDGTLITEDGRKELSEYGLKVIDKWCQNV
jgi:nucleoredoxin